MKKIMIIAFVLAFTGLSYAQTEQDAVKYAETITEDELYDKLSILASDAMEGRETGERGQKMAAAFISDHFQRLGLKAPVKSGTENSYYQPVFLYSAVPGDTYIIAGEEKHKNFDKIIYYGSSSSGAVKETEVLFAGKGSEQDFAQLDVKDKAVIVMVDNPRAWKAPHDLALEKGASLTLIVSHKDDAKFTEYGQLFKGFLEGGRLSLEKPDMGGSDPGVFFIAPSVAAQILDVKKQRLQDAMEKGNLKKIKKGTFKYHMEQKIKEVESENVLGYMEGSDLKDELVVITAHYDHIGKNGEQINNGADDDGSGTSAVLEIAEAFVQAKADGKGPRRSILFMTVTGEEKGLLGSAYYTSNPIFPLEKTVVDLNIDMIGRIDHKHKENPEYVYLVGSDRLSTELHEISEKVNETYTKLELDYTYNDEDHPDRIYYRSDHWNFAKNNIPIIFYFNGVHDDYHQPTDTIDKIAFDMLMERTKLVYHTAWVLANRDQKPVVDKPQSQNLGNN
ncbi:M28 family peptidase [Fulvivirga sp. M361]|uniref:M28 family peptidase n=1 Tax=Fulvivirga sp. M361 TaxID=2594266 RepID=UPI00117B399C|nr:M28 family peptidase [Fulvivirga sp. M361]TRX62773.1 M28 family peptidase [Fulvivirga sp. M361]